MERSADEVMIALKAWGVIPSGLRYRASSLHDETWERVPMSRARVQARSALRACSLTAVLAS